MKKKSQSVVILEDAFYTIAAANGRVLEVANFNPDNGAPIQLWDYAGKPWQQWSFSPVGGGAYRIKNRFTGKVVDLAFRTTTQGTLLHQWNEVSSTSQHWQLEETARGTRIRNVLSGKSLDLAEMSTANGARAQIWGDVEGGNQEWNIRRVPERAGEPTPAAEAARAASLQEQRSSALVRKISGEKDARRKGRK
jgi:hypothetical protein